MANVRLKIFESIVASVKVASHDRLSLTSAEFRPEIYNSNSKKQVISSASLSSQYGTSTKKSKANTKNTMIKLKASAALSNNSSKFPMFKQNSYQKLTTSADSYWPSNTSNYVYHDPNTQEYNYQVPVNQLPHIQQFFPNINQRTQIRKLMQIDEIQNDSE